MKRLAWLALAGPVACGARTELDVAGGDDGVGGAGGAGGASVTVASGGGGAGAGGGGVGGVEQLALGAQHTCLRTKQGDVYCWGGNGDGQLGLGIDTPQVPLPSKVELGERATYLAAGTYHTCAILEDGHVWCWGKNLSHQVGDGSADGAVSTPVEVPSSAPAVALALGEAHSCGLFEVADIDDLHCWGSGSDGQTGLTMTTGVPTPVATSVVSVAAGAFHTCFVFTGGLVQCMGSNSDLQLGVEGIGGTATPTTPTGLESIAMDAVASGKGFHTCGVSAGRIYCWGDDDQGQLGAGFTSPHELVTSPIGVPDGVPAIAVAPGFAHTAALFGDGVFAWGSNFSGQLGYAGPDATIATPVSGLGDVIAIGSGTLHTCAYVSPTEIYCWGGNDFGQLGDGTTSASSTPVKVVLP
jgi:alpha-tubulin suppressor-like RCC1 family protein